MLRQPGNERQKPPTVVKTVRRRSSGKSSEEKVVLERTIGTTAARNSCLSASQGLVAFPAGCVSVLYNVRKNRQRHVLNHAKKPISCLQLSADARYLVTGESGHNPAVRIYDLATGVTDSHHGVQVAELFGHQHGISCVVFSPNLKYLVSVGYDHDMLVNVWQWKSGAKVATNKVSAKVLGLAISESGDYFVTVGNRHVKFWYFDTDKKGKKLNAAHPLQGRSGILGEQRNQCFQDVVCGRGTASQKTFSVTRAGHLVEFNNQRMLERLVNLKVPQASCVTATENYVICGCSNGIIRLFNPLSLQFVCVMPHPHTLEVTIPSTHTAENVESSANKFPDVLSIAIDETNQKMSVVYTDHSFYMWNVKDLNQITKSKSFLAHSNCIWGVETCPSACEDSKCPLPAGTFVTCSADSTLMFWNLDNAVEATNIYCKELQRVIYVNNSEEEQLTEQRDQSPPSDSADGESKCGIRVVKLSPDGQFLACGDRAGNIKVYDLEFMSEVLKVEAHDSEILGLDFSHSLPGHHYLVSSSRDRLIHVFNIDNAYELLQTIDDHSGAVTSVRFTAQQNQLHLMSCGADKSIMFRTLVTTSDPKFVMSHHVSTKATLYDMQIDATGKYAAVACQDRKVRIYNINSGKLTRSYKASLSDEGTLIKIELDRSGLYAATSGSDKVLCLYDFYSGQCIAKMYGHSELVTDVKFSRDITRLISVSGDSCIFVWKLAPSLTQAVQERMTELSQCSAASTAASGAKSRRRETYSVDSALPDETDLGESLLETEVKTALEVESDEERGEEDVPYRYSVSKLPAWLQRQMQEQQQEQEPNLQPRAKWAERPCVMNLAKPDSSTLLEPQSDTTSSVKSSGLESSAPNDKETETTEENSKGADGSEEDKSESDEDMNIMFSTQQDDTADGPSLFEVTSFPPPENECVADEDQSPVSEPSTPIGSNEPPVSDSFSTDENQLFKTTFGSLTSSVADLVFGQYDEENRDASMSPRRSLTAKFLSEHTKKVTVRQQPDGEEKKGESDSTGNEPVEIPPESEPSADDIDVDKPQVKAERQEVQTTTVSGSQPVGRRINSGPSVGVATVSEKTIEERKIEMAEEVEKTRKRLEELGWKAPPKAKSKASTSEEEGVGLDSSPPSKRKHRVLPEQPVGTPIVPMPQSRRAQQARAARRAAKASQPQALQQQQQQQQQQDQAVQEGEPGATSTDVPQAAEPDSTAATSPLISNTDEVEKEVRDIHNQLRTLLERSQTLLTEWKQKEGGNQIVTLIEDMLREVNNDLQSSLNPTASQTSASLDTHALLQQYSDALVDLVRERLAAQTDSQS